MSKKKKEQATTLVCRDCAKFVINSKMGGVWWCDLYGFPTSPNHRMCGRMIDARRETQCS